MIRNRSHGNTHARGMHVSMGKNLGQLSRTAALAGVVLAGCGGGEKGVGNTPPSTPTNDSITVSVVSGKAMIELGPVSGASVEIHTPEGQLITTAITNHDGTFSYTIPSSMINTIRQYEVLKVVSRNGTDTDPADSGNPATATARAVNGVVQGFVPSNIIALGGTFRINPMNAFITESILRSGGDITMDRLNKQARELGTTDMNQDGVVDYQDLLEHKMTDNSPAKDASQGFLQTLHSGDTTAQAQIIEQAQLQQNLASIHLVPGDFGRPSVELTKSPAASKTIFTLDGSTPEIKTGTTRDYSPGSRFTAQNAELNYREVFLVNGKEMAGENKSFHLQHDAVTWSEEQQTAASTISANPSSEVESSYGNGTYSIVTQYNIENNNRKYPGIMWVKIAPKSGYTGENRSSKELVIYSDSYAQTLRSALILAAQDEIGLQQYQKIATPLPTPAPTHLQNFQETVYAHEVYKGGWLEVINQWNLDGTTDYPVKIIGLYSLPLSGRQVNKTLIANNANELTSKKNQLITEMHAAIDTEFNAQPKSQYTQNQKFETGNLSYRGGYYNLITLMNINGNADYPANVKGSYQTPGGSEQILNGIYANNATQLTQVQNQQTAYMKAQIDLVLDDKYTAGYTETLQSNISYNGGTYTVKFQYSTNAKVDYPGMIIIDYRLPTGVVSNWSLEAVNLSDRGLGIANGVGWVRAKIDDAALAAKHPINDTTSTGSIKYRIGDYSLYAKYNRVGTNRDFPALVYGEYHTSPGGALKSTTRYEVNSEAEKESKKAEIASYIQSQIPVHVPNDIVTSQSYYHNGDYAIKIKYNRVGTDQDFPVLLWVEYHLSQTSPLQTPAPVEVTSEAALQTGLTNLHAKMRQLIDTKYYSFNGMSTEAKTQFANLTKSIQFFPSAIAATNTTATMRKDTPVTVARAPYKECSGKYPITVTKTTSNSVDNILMYRSQYQFAPGVSLIAKMQFDSNISNGNVCEVEKKMDSTVAKTFAKSYNIDGVIYIGEGGKEEIEIFLASMMTANREGKDTESFLKQLVQKYKVSSKDIDRIRLHLLVTSPLMDDTGDVFYLIPFGKILSYGGSLTFGLGEGFQKIMSEWGSLVKNTRGSIVIKNFSEDLFQATKNGMVPLINKYGVNYRLHGVKMLQHVKNSATYAAGKSYFLESMTEKDIMQLHVEIMAKYDKEIWQGMLKDELSNGKGVIIEVGKVVGTYVNKGGKEIQNVTKLKFVSQGDGTMHAYPWFIE